MTITLTDIITSKTKILKHSLKKEVVRESSFLYLINNIKPQLDPKYNYEFYVDGEKLDNESLNAFVYEDDILTIIQKPAAGVVTAAAVYKLLLSAAISYAINYAVNYFFDGKSSVKDEVSPDASYSMNNSNNFASVGTYIGTGYGTFKLYPRIVNQPFTYFEDNKQHMIRTFVVGQGDYELIKSELGSQESISTISTSLYLRKNKKFKDIVNVPQMPSDIINRLDTVNNDTVLFYNDLNVIKHVLTPKISAVSINLIYPQGLYITNEKGRPAWLKDEVEFIFMDDSGHIVDRFLRTYSSREIRREELRVTELFTRPTHTYWHTLEIVKKNYNKPRNDSESKDLRVSDIYEVYPDKTLNHGNVTQVYSHMVASSTVNGADKLRLTVRRKDKGNSLVDVVSDIYSNTTYGGNLPTSDLVFDSEATNVKINAYFSETQETVMDSIDKVIRPQMFHLTLDGDKIRVEKDKPKTIPIQKYDNTRMFDVQTSYIFDTFSKIEDGVEVEYRDSRWLPATVKYPENSLNTTLVKTFGLEDENAAKTYAKYLYKQEKSRRHTLSFSTDIQGRVLSFLDLIEVTHETVDFSSAPKLFQVLKVQVSEEKCTVECINYEGEIYR